MLTINENHKEKFFPRALYLHSDHLRYHMRYVYYRNEVNVVNLLLPLLVCKCTAANIVLVMRQTISS